MCVYFSIVCLYFLYVYAIRFYNRKIEINYYCYYYYYYYTICTTCMHYRAKFEQLQLISRGAQTFIRWVQLTLKTLTRFIQYFYELS